MAINKNDRARKILHFSILFVSILFLISCGATYNVKPLPLKTPAAYSNSMEVAGTIIGGRAYVDSKESKEAFGFNIREAGMLPVQLVFDNHGTKSLWINSSQTFLEDKEGNLWPVLSRKMAYERATKYAQTKQVFTEGAKAGFLGGAAGAVIGAAIGVVTGENVASSAGKGAAVGAAAGATAGGVKGYTSDEARRDIIDDLKKKDLEQMNIEPGSLSYGFLFFPGEAKSAVKLRLQLIEEDNSTIHNLTLNM
jgi:hypothetical protein